MLTLAPWLGAVMADVLLSPSLQSYAAMDAHQIAGLVLFMMLCFGCIYVWVSLLFSCVRMTREVSPPAPP